MEQLQMKFSETETACTIPCVNNWAFFGDTLIGQVIAENYNQWLKRNILTIKTTSGTITKIQDPRNKVTKWHLKPCC